VPGRSGLYLGGYLGPTTYLGGPSPLGQAGETSSSTPMRRRKVRHLGRVAGPVLLGYGLDPYGTAPYGSPAYQPATEVELARPVARRKLRRSGQAAETGTAGRVRPQKRRRIGPGLERQRARPLRRRAVLEPVVEHDTAQSVRPRKVRRIGRAVEVSTVCSFVTAGGYGDGGYGTTPYPGPQVGARRRRRKVGVGKERQRAQRITPS
jgi:hypothetical protein